jgi:hypothetical protein
MEHAGTLSIHMLAGIKVYTQQSMQIRKEICVGSGRQTYTLINVICIKYKLWKIERAIVNYAFIGKAGK